MRYTRIIYSDELAHHGIKGQKWGVRRYQNPDGSLTEEGKKRYGSVEGFNAYQKMQKTKQQLLNIQKVNRTQFTNKGYKQEQELIKKLNIDKADYEAIRGKKGNAEISKDKIARNIAIGVAVTAGLAIGGIAVSKYLGKHKDVVIKGGQLVQRIAKGDDLHDEFFAGFGKRDIARYQNMMPKHLLDNYSAKNYNVFKMRAKENVKIASPKNAEKIFEKLKSEGKLNTSLSYSTFNKQLVGPYAHKSQDAQTFYKAIKEKGYSGIIDLNDKYGGFMTKNPAIIIDKGKMTMESIDKMKIDPKIANRMHIKETNKMIREEFLKSLAGPENLAGVGLGAGLAAADKSASAAYKQKIVNKYKKEHPGTELTNDQIIARYQGK